MNPLYKSRKPILASLIFAGLLVSVALLLAQSHRKQQQLAFAKQQQAAEESKLDSLVDQYNGDLSDAEGDQRSIKAREAEIAETQRKLEEASVSTPYPLINQSNRDLSTAYTDEMDADQKEKSNYRGRLQRDVEKAKSALTSIKISPLFVHRYKEAGFCLDASDVDMLPQGAEQLRFVERH